LMISSILALALPMWPKHGYDERHSGASPLSGAAVGVLKYTAHTDGSIIDSSPMINSDGSFVVATTQGLVAAFSSSSQPLWNYTLPPLTRGTRSSAAILGGLVILPTHNGTIFAFELASGALQWTYVHTTPIELSSVAFDGASGALFFGCNLGLVALDKQGHKLWANDSYSMVLSTPTVYNGLIYFGCIYNQDAHGALFVLNASTGYMVSKWQLPGYSWVVGSPSITDDGIIIVCSAGDAAVYAFASSDLTHPLWSYTNYSILDSTVASPAVLNGWVYIVSGNGRLVALDSKNGAPRWVVDLPYSPELFGCFASPPLDGRQALYVACYNFLASFQASDGQLLWNSTLPGVTTYSSPAVANGWIVLGLGNGDVLTFV